MLDEVHDVGQNQSTVSVDFTIRLALVVFVDDCDNG